MHRLHLEALWRHVQWVYRSQGIWLIYMQQSFQNSFVHVFPNCHSKPFYHGRTEVFNLWFTLYLLHCCYYHQLSRRWQWARFLNSWLIKKLKIELKLTITVRHYTLYRVNIIMQIYIVHSAKVQTLRIQLGSENCLHD
jgi:hypothetical protein